jgi:hypothetical protein
LHGSSGRRSDRLSLLEEATKLQAAGQLWRPFADKTYKNGTVARTRLVCHGVLNFMGNEAADTLGGFGEPDVDEDIGVAEPVDFAAIGEPSAHAKEDEN